MYTRSNTRSLYARSCRRFSHLFSLTTSTLSMRSKGEILWISEEDLAGSIHIIDFWLWDSSFQRILLSICTLLARKITRTVSLSLIRITALPVAVSDSSFASSFHDLVRRLYYIERSSLTDRVKSSYPRSEEEELKTENVWLKGHAGLRQCSPLRIRELIAPILDHTTLTVLWSQPVAALQLRDADDKWRWVKHVENALVSSTCKNPLCRLTHNRYSRRWSTAETRSKCCQVDTTSPQFTVSCSPQRIREDTAG